MARVLILGAYGLLGSTLCHKLTTLGSEVFRQGRNAVSDICIVPTNSTALTAILMQKKIDVIVNLIALTDVDQCEINIPQAYQANVRVVESIATSINNFRRGRRPHLVQISTDQVYDGIGPHTEGVVNPCNVYALTKLTAEVVAASVGATVLRTNFFGRSHCRGRASLTDWIINSLLIRQPITVLDDVLFSALHIDTLCEAIASTVYKRCPGIFNVGCRNGDSKAHLAFGLAKRLELDPSPMTIGKLQDIKLFARRPSDMRMNSSCFEKVFDFSTPDFESQIDHTAQEYRDAQTTA